MTTRVRAWSVCAGTLLVASAVWWASRAPRPTDARPVVEGAEATTTAPIGFGLERPEPAPLEVPRAGAPDERAVASAEAAADAARRVAALVESLRRADEGPEAGFHESVTEAVTAFLEGEARLSRDGPTGAGREVVARLDADVDEPRVRGALLGVLRALGDETAAAKRWIADGEPERLALVIGGWVPREGTPEAGVVVLDPDDYVAAAPRGDLDLVSIVLRRAVDEPLRTVLLDEVRRLAADWDSLLTRDLRVLALGTRLDFDDRVLETFRGLLFDPQQAQLDDSVLYALVHARSEAARALVLEFLDDAQTPEHAKTRARWLLAKAPMLPDEFQTLVAPLLDDGAPREARVMATGSMLPVLERADEAQRERVEAILAERVRRESDEFVRCCAIDVLAIGLQGGSTRFLALADALRRDASRRCRSAAAEGLSSVPGHLTADALGVLRAALAAERDESVRKVIASSIAALGG